MEERVARPAPAPAPTPETAAPERPTRKVRRHAVELGGSERLQRQAGSARIGRSAGASRAVEPGATTVRPLVGGVATATAARVSPLGAALQAATSATPSVSPAPALPAGSAASVDDGLDTDDGTAASVHQIAPPPRAGLRRAIRRSAAMAAGTAHPTTASASNGACRIRPASPRPTAGALGPTRSGPARVGTPGDGPALRRSIVPGGAGRSLVARALSAPVGKDGTRYVATGGATAG